MSAARSRRILAAELGAPNKGGRMRVISCATATKLLAERAGASDDESRETRARAPVTFPKRLGQASYRPATMARFTTAARSG